jgi:hypothetical protein
MQYGLKGQRVLLTVYDWTVCIVERTENQQCFITLFQLVPLLLIIQTRPTVIPAVTRLIHFELHCTVALIVHQSCSSAVFACVVLYGRLQGR